MGTKADEDEEDDADQPEEGTEKTATGVTAEKDNELERVREALHRLAGGGPYRLRIGVRRADPDDGFAGTFRNFTRPMEDLEEEIQRRWGGGLYDVEIRLSDGKYAGSLQLRIGGTPRPIGVVAASEAPEPERREERLEIDDLVDRAVDRRTRATVDPVALKAEILAELRGVSTESSVVTKALEALGKLAAPSAGPAPPSPEVTALSTKLAALEAELAKTKGEDRLTRILRGQSKLIRKAMRPPTRNPLEQAIVEMKQLKLFERLCSEDDGKNSDLFDKIKAAALKRIEGFIEPAMGMMMGAGARPPVPRPAPGAPSVQVPPQAGPGQPQQVSEAEAFRLWMDSLWGEPTKALDDTVVAGAARRWPGEMRTLVSIATRPELADFASKVGGPQQRTAVDGLKPDDANAILTLISLLRETHGRVMAAQQATTPATTPPTPSAAAQGKVIEMPRPAPPANGASP